MLSLDAIAGISLTDIAAGTGIYASDDATLTATSSGNTRVGAVAEIQGARVVVSAATINAAKAVTVPAGASGGLFGAKTIVVSTTGDDTAGAASKYTAEFLTIQAALDAAAAGDVVIVRPGTYTEAVLLPTGVHLHGLPGAIIHNATNGGFCLRDGAATIDAAVTGDFRLTASGGAGCVQISGTDTDLRIECDSLAVTGGAGPTMSIAGGATARSLTVKAKRTITNVAGKALDIAGVDAATVIVEALQAITADIVLDDSHSSGATSIVIRSPFITATDASGNDGVRINNHGAAKYWITADNLVCSVNNNGTAAKVWIDAGNWTTYNATTVPFSASAAGGESFLSVRGNCTPAAHRPILVIDGITHLLRGRFIGRTGAAGFALQIFAAASIVRLYPGAVLIGGPDVSTSIDFGGGETAGTVVAMGAIAVNKAKAVGVTVTVGSLLVDAAVV